MLLNHPEINLGEHLSTYLSFTSALPPDLRGEALSNDELIRSTHNSFARSAPFISEDTRGGKDEDVFHFIAYTPVNGVLYELDGLQEAPIAHGNCTPEEFAEKVVPVLQDRVARYPGEIRFNLLACCGDLREKYRSLGDEEGVENEERKRRGVGLGECT